MDLPLMRTQNPNWKEPLSRRLLLLGAILVLLWVVEIADWVVWHGAFDRFGIQPRTLIGLRNIFLAPWVHVGFGHLLANSLPFLFLGWLVSLYGLPEFWRVSLVAALVSGLGVWLLGAPHTLHLGLSGVIFGYLGYLLLRGVFERSLQAIVVAILAFLLYGSLLWGLIAWQPGVSWLGHLFGFLGGALAARQIRSGTKSLVG
jgi:membrane associated rhomboid family serine protease